MRGPSHTVAVVIAVLAGLLFAAIPVSAFTVLGSGTTALLGGDLTDPENDGSDVTGANFNWVTITASSENYWTAEGAFNVFDNQVGSNDAKWCCDPAPQWIAVKFDKPYVLTHFTLSAGNDAPERDPTRWSMEGSNDGTTWTTIYDWNAGVSVFSQRYEVIRFDGGGVDFPSPAPYLWFRYHALATNAAMHQVNEIELFGLPTVVIKDFAVNKPQIPQGEPITLSWEVDPRTTNIVISGVGNVTAQTVNGIGRVTLSPGPATTTVYTMSATHPDTTAQQTVTVNVTDQPVIQAFSASPAIIGPGDSATLAWEVFNAGSLFLNGNTVTGTTSQSVSPTSTTTYTLTAVNLQGSASSQTTVTVVEPGVPTISEFMAGNDGALIADEDRDFSDWIEVHNPSATTAQLQGYFLTDNPAELRKWAFPSVTLPPGGYLIVFASGKNRTSPGAPLHTNFSLDVGGEYLALIKPDGVTIVSEFGPGGTMYPDQNEGVSFGLVGNPPQQGYFTAATPGIANGSGFSGYVKDTKFSVNRGFYASPQTLTISSATPGASIRYTTDGAWPSETAGLLYTAAITVARTMPVRAIAYKPGYRSTNVDTHTYIFVDDVVTQTAATTQSTWGLPALWGSQAPDYGMDPRVTTPYAPTIRDDLRTVPSLSVVIDVRDMFGPSGIYANPNSSGPGWERVTSLELIDPAQPDGSKNFQLNCGIRIQGGAFRGFGLTPKKAFRVLFKDIYGPTKLRYPLFGRGAAQEFDSLTLRMESNDGYQWDNRTDVQYARDEFGRRTALDLGIPSARGRYLHLYINGVYWGIYNVVERPDSSFGEQYFGAKKEEWDAISFGAAVNEGSTVPWNTMVSLLSGITSATTETGRTAALMRAQGLNPDGTKNPGWADYINVDNYIDYLLVNWFIGNNDWPHRNYYTGRERDVLDAPPLRGSRTSQGMHFFMWDAETSMGINSSNDKTGDTSGVAVPYGHLRNSQEFRVRFGDRAYRALFNGGALTPQPCLDRYAAITKDHRAILVPELARWGDQHGTLRTLQQWETEYNDVRNNWLAIRAPAFVSVLKGANLYPQTGSPTFSLRGGSVSPTTPVTMTANADRIYYTVDGTDPRLIGGAANPTARVVSFVGAGANVTDPIFFSQPTAVKARAFNSGTGEWSPIGEVFFSIDSTPANASNLVISEFSYQPGDPSPEEKAVSTDGDDFEFIELLNIGAQTIDLTGVSFVGGVSFTFADNTLVTPGNRIVVAKNRAAFSKRYSAVMGSMALAGEFASGSLSNDGEPIVVSSLRTGLIRDFTYDDQEPWPTAADGDGFSLVLIAPRTNPDANLAANWRSSTVRHGNPGATDAVGYAQWKLMHGVNGDEDDLDQDGLSAFAEYVFGTPPDAPSDLPVTSRVMTVSGQAYVAIDIRRSLAAADDARFLVESSADLVQWVANAVYVGETRPDGGQTATVTYRAPQPISESSQVFLRASLIPR